MLRLLKEATEIHERRTNNILDSFVLVRDLVDLGALEVVGKSLQLSRPKFFTPPLLNSWVAYGGGYAVPGYYKDPFGRVHLKGLVKDGTAAASIMFTLPIGYCPSERLLFNVQANAALGRVDVYPNGSVELQSGSTTWVSLDGISFAAQQ